MSRKALLLNATSITQTGAAPALVTRPPLVLPAGPFRGELPWTLPLSRDFLRADSWGVTVPGAPWVPGASTRHPERILSWFIDRYPQDFQQRYLETVASYGYTHVKVSPGDSMGPVDNGPFSPPGNAQSLEQFVETCLRLKQVQSARTNLPLYVAVMLGSKYFHQWNMSLHQYQDVFGPMLEALFEARAVDELVPGWEWNLWNPDTSGPTTIAIFKWVGQQAHANGASCWAHFSPEKTSWFADKEPRGRFGFWDDLGADVDGLNYQTDPHWSMKDTQDRIVDTLWQFGQQGNIHKFRFDEDQAALMWDNDRPNEDDANARGFLACCTIDDVKRTDAKVWGYGNGGRSRDGSPL